MKTQSKHLFLLGLLAFVAIIATGCPHKSEPEPTPATPTITMKNGSDFQKLLVGANLKANSEATSFKASETPAPAGVTTETLSADGSETECVAWFDNSTKTIYYSAKGYTDANKKIPVSDFHFMFAACSTLETIDISGFDTSAVAHFGQLFQSCTALTTIVGLDTLNTTSATRFIKMFYNCSALTEIDIRSFDASKIVYAEDMFGLCTNLTTIYAKAGTDWSSIDTITSSAGMFTNCTSLKGGAGTTFGSAKTDKNYARIDGGTSQPGYFTEK